MTDIFQVEMGATLGCKRRLDEEEITDMIAAVVDDLDLVVLDPSVGTVRIGDDVELTVSMTVDEPDEWNALTHGASAMRTAFRAAGIGAAGLVVPRDLRSHVTPLQAA